MGKIIVIYHSQQYGDTKSLAEALAEGARGAGAEVSLINTNERRVAPGRIFVRRWGCDRDA